MCSWSEPVVPGYGDLWEEPSLTPVQPAALQEKARLILFSDSVAEV